MRITLVLGVLGVVVLARRAEAAPAIAITPSPFASYNGFLYDGGFPNEQQFALVTIGNPGTTTLTVTEMAFTGPGADLISFYASQPCDTGTVCTQTFTIDPGASAFVQATCTATQPGTFAATLTVTSDAASGSNEVALPCKGFYTPVIEVSPATGLDFGSQHICYQGDACGPRCATQPATQTLTLTNTAPEPSEVDLSAMLPFGASFSGGADQSMPMLLGSGQSAHITLTFHPAPPDPVTFDAPLTLTSVYPADLPPINVPFHAHGGSGHLAVDTSHIGAGVIGQPLTGTLVSHGDGGSCIDLYEAFFVNFDSFTVVSPQIDLQHGLEVQDGEVLDWQVSCIPQSVGDNCEYLHVTSVFDDPEEGDDYLVCCTGVEHALAAPATAGLPDTVRHPATPTSQVVTIQNQTSSAVDLTTIAVDGAGFALVGPATATIAAGGSVDITIAFSPPSIGDFTGHLVVGNANDPALASVGLNGHGVLRDLTVSATTVDLGAVGVGSTATADPIAIHNTSATATFTLSSVTVTGAPAFQVTGPDRMTLAPGETAVVQVRVAPTAAGALAAQIAIFADGDPDPLAQIGVTATAVDGAHHGGCAAAGGSLPIALALLALRRRRRP